MSNRYVSMMKDYVRNYQKKEMQYQEQRLDAKRKYSAEFAQSALAKNQEQATASYFHYKSAIGNVFNEIRENLSAACYPDIDMIPEAERNLFSANSPIKLTPNEIKMKISQYKNNFMVQRMISDYIDRQRQIQNREAESTSSAPADIYADCKVFTPEDHLKIYKQFADSALSMIDSIHYAPQNSSASYVEAFADENFASELFEVIGDGESLKQYKNKPYYSIASHSFDSVNVNE